ncbi:hypothetical protein [Actinoplanes sp. NPDC051851]|uniref:hypothetical protein n=1 Tax=Actinoplanes sp. NPDC051851 TaxID=3154753 RepID=UPI0034256069
MPTRLTRFLAAVTTGCALAASTVLPARAATPSTLFRTYTGTTSWTSATVKLPAKKYRAVATYKCTGSAGGYLYVSWHGTPFAFEMAQSRKAKGTITLTGKRGARNGYFEVSTWYNCTWTLKVYR